MKRIHQPRLEWALLAIIAVVCAVLSFLQYRWTGEVSRAERARLRASLIEQVNKGKSIVEIRTVSWVNPI